MKFDPRHLEHLSIIADSGTLQAAAQSIGTSQPALSRMISTLESRLGSPLFHRSRPLRPTSLGLELAAQGRAVRAARERAEELVEHDGKGFFGVLKIGAPPFICERLVCEAINSFLTDRPAIRVDLIPDYFPGLHERLFQNQIDLIVGPAKSADPSYSEVRLEALFDDCNVVVCRNGHPLLTKEQVTDLDLEAARWVGHSDHSKLRHDMETALRLLGVRNLRFAFQSASAGAVFALVRTSDFLTVLPSYAIRGAEDQGLAVLPINLPTADQTIVTMTYAKRQETALTTEFKMHLRNHVTKGLPAKAPRTVSPQAPDGVKISPDE